MSDSRTHTATSSISSTLATPLASHQPLTVQESRDKRLARQQARFRDRGGIFVSQQRTALLDVLLGKKTLKQVTARRSRSRSASCSPIRRKSGKVVGDEVRPNAGRKSIVQVEDDQDEPVPGPSKVALKKAAPARKGRKKATAVATRTKKSQVEDTVPDATAGSDDFFSKPTTDISNNDTKKVSKARGAARKTKGTSVAAEAKGKGKGKGKAKLADVQVEEQTDNAEESVVAKQAKTSKSKANESQTKSKAKAANTRKAANKQPLPSSDTEQDRVEDAPSSPLARRGRRRTAATKPKNYADEDPEDVDEKPNSRPREKVLASSSSTSKKTPASSRSKKSTKKQPQEEEEEEESPKPSGSKRARPALTPVPEEPEPDSDMEREHSAARSAQDLAVAISKAIEDFAPVSRDKVEGKEKGTTAGKGKKKAATVKEKGKGKGRGREEDKEIIVDLVDTQKKSRVNKEKVDAKDSTVDDEENIAGSVEEPKAETKKTRGKGGGRTKTQASVDANEGDTAAADLLLQSPPRPLKRTRAVVEPEPDEVVTTSRKKAKTTSNVTVDAFISVSTPAKGTRSKGSRGQGGDVDIDKGDEVSGKKRKRAAVVADVEEVDEKELPEPEPKKKKEDSSATPRKPVRRNKKASTSSSKSPSKPRSELKTASRKKKENPIETSEAPAPTKKSTTKKPPAVSKAASKAKRGPPQSVLDRIKKSASATINADYDEPDELDLLS